MIVYAVEEDKLHNVHISTDTETLSVVRYWLIYEVEPIDIYTGHCEIYCFNIENEWVITYAEKRYDTFGGKYHEPLNV